MGAGESEQVLHKSVASMRRLVNMLHSRNISVDTVTQLAGYNTSCHGRKLLTARADTLIKSHTGTDHRRSEAAGTCSSERAMTGGPGGEGSGTGQWRPVPIRESAWQTA